MKNRKLGLVLLASAILTATYIPTSRASADTTQLKQTNVIQDAGQTTETAKLSDSENNQLTENQINQLDPYVKVVNNQYVLQLPENNNVSQSMVTEIEDELSQVNADIKSNGYTIKTNDKTYGASTSAAFGVVLAKSSSNPTIKRFWWGIRVYMRNKTAVNKEIAEFKNGQAIAEFGSLVSPPVGVTLSVYFSNIADHLTNMRDAHPHSKLYMDIDRFGVYKIKTY